jgi:hypothetical protein
MVVVHQWKGKPGSVQQKVPWVSPAQSALALQSRILNVTGVPAFVQGVAMPGGFSPGTLVWQLEVNEAAVQPGKRSPPSAVTRMP